MLPERFGSSDGIVIRDGHKVHPAEFEDFVGLFGVVIAFATEPFEEGNSALPRVNGMNVEVAPHRTFVHILWLQSGDLLKKHS
jgi:hypothetical protein